jgi:sec-independent protein translocase protein TatA
MANISPWQLLIILLIVLLIFGTKKLRNIGGDLGGAMRDFRKGLSDGEQDESNANDAKATSSENEDGSGSTKP